MSAVMRQGIPTCPSMTKDSDFDVRRRVACNPKLKEVLTDKK